MGVKASASILILEVLNANGEKKEEWRFNSKTKMRMSWGPGGGYKENTTCVIILQIDLWASGVHASVLNCVACLCLVFESFNRDAT